MFVEGLAKFVMKVFGEGKRLTAAINLDSLPRGINNDAAVGTVAHVLFKLHSERAVHFIVQVAGQLQNNLLTAHHAMQRLFCSVRSSAESCGATSPEVLTQLFPKLQPGSQQPRFYRWHGQLQDLGRLLRG